MEPKWSLESIFTAIKSNAKKVMLFREGVEGLGLAGPWAQARGHLFIGVVRASTKRRFAQKR